MSVPSSAPPRAPVRPRRWPAIGIAIAALACGGCEQHLDARYGTVRGPSLNGVSAFAQLLRDTGHALTAQRSMPAAIAADVRCVVLFDGSFDRLPPAASDVLGPWLDAGGPRTLLLVLRDSDAVIDYVREILATDTLSEGVRSHAETLLASAESALVAATAEARPATPPLLDRLVPVTREASDDALKVRLAGLDDPISARWELHRRLAGDKPDDILWASGADRLLVRRRKGDAEILVLASATPLLNGGLVDPGNRRLAEQLASLLPTDGPCLLAGSTPAAGGNAETAEQDPSAWRLLAVPPLPWVAMQILVALSLFGWCMSPIFGRPRKDSPEAAQDFGHHVDALAAMLARSRDAGAAFSRRRIEEWTKASPIRPARRHRRHLRHR